MTSKYLMENEREADRLEAKTDAGFSRRLLKEAGLKNGMRALDAGAGTGAVAREMSTLVGKKGCAFALDASHDRLSAGKLLARSKRRRLHFLQGDLSSIPLRTGSLDFIWSRFVFEYLSNPDEVLGELTRLLRPGGKIVVGDLDGNGIFHYPISPSLEKRLGLVISGLKGRLDPHAGRKLYHRFRMAGLADVKVAVMPYHLYCNAIGQGDLDNWRLKLETLRPIGEAALGGAKAYRSFSKEYLELLRDPDALSYSLLFMVQGLKAAR